MFYNKYITPINLLLTLFFCFTGVDIQGEDSSHMSRWMASPQEIETAREILQTHRDALLHDQPNEPMIIELGGGAP